MKKSIISVLAFAFGASLVLSSFTGCQSTKNTAAAESAALSIGDTGEGGGLVFQIKDGLYYECAELPDRVKWEDADAAAKAYNGGGFTDWRLPNREELDAIYQNLRAKEIITGNGLYWTSELQDENHAWGQRFNNGGTGAHDLTVGHSHNVFAVRTFRR